MIETYMTTEQMQTKIEYLEKLVDILLLTKADSKCIMIKPEHYNLLDRYRLRAKQRQAYRDRKTEAESEYWKLTMRKSELEADFPDLKK